MMSAGIMQLVDLLVSGNHSLVIGNGGEVSVFDGRGVGDLLRLLHDSPEKLAGASVADKVVGKGAAALMIAGGVRRLHALVISRPALELFRSVPEAVEVTYGTLVRNIMNRTGTGCCPVETLCAGCATANECIPLIERFVESNI